MTKQGEEEEEDKSPWVFFRDFRRISNQHAQSHGVLQSRPRTRLAATKLLNRLRHSHTILPEYEVKQAQSMILRNEARRRDDLLATIGQRRRSKSKIQIARGGAKER